MNDLSRLTSEYFLKYTWIAWKRECVEFFLCSESHLQSFRSVIEANRCRVLFKSLCCITSFFVLEIVLKYLGNCTEEPKFLYLLTFCDSIWDVFLLQTVFIAWKKPTGQWSLPYWIVHRGNPRSPKNFWQKMNNKVGNWKASEIVVTCLSPRFFQIWKLAFIS